ncbi:hypothetical protein VP1G_11247 [Cytospora mali]|uniref:Uncharacterized protein n=1 Tax=Cytospora mali TaxID=578113 RepID=A0A194VB64_CYTMA|nr:hypothetical protein VP1G_11247 [Valsa mali var. pyri (nom. inval.)]
MRSGDLDGVSSNKSRTILTLIVLTLSLKDIETLTPEIMEETCDQLKKLLFAGPLKAVHDKLDTLFGPGAAHDPAVVREKLLASDGETLVNHFCRYQGRPKDTSAGRFHSHDRARRKIMVSTPQGEDNLNGNWIYLNHSIIHRDRAVFGDIANDCVPERWLQSDVAGVYPASA